MDDSSSGEGMVDQALLFMCKTMINNLITLFPLGSLPETDPTSEEAILFNKAIKTVMYNAEVNQVDPEHFIKFCEAFRKTLLFLMEQDGYYRKYVKMFFDIVKMERSEK